MIVCTNCRRPLLGEGAPFRCLTCGGIYDYDTSFTFDPNQIDPSQPGVWRYRHTFGLSADAPVVSLGEGGTPLIWGEAFGKRVAFKLEFMNPTGSFKDRGSAVLTSFLLSRGVEMAVEDSSGNAGASFAGYAARAGIRARVYVPESASGPKRKQIEAYGAEVVPVSGPRSEAGEAALRAEKEGAIYASHAYMPWNLPGYATAAYEVFEQLGSLPGTIILPVGQGGLLLGMYRGFLALKEAGLTSGIPMFVGVQARACAPLWAVSEYGWEGLSWVSEGTTLAEGIRVLRPLRGDVVIQSVKTSGGYFVSVEEEALLLGRERLAQRGFYVEPTSAVVWDAVAQVFAQGGGQAAEPVVVMLTGFGLKTG